MSSLVSSRSAGHWRRDARTGWCGPRRAPRRGARDGDGEKKPSAGFAPRRRPARPRRLRSSARTPYRMSQRRTQRSASAGPPDTGRRGHKGGGGVELVRAAGRGTSGPGAARGELSGGVPRLKTIEFGELRRQMTERRRAGAPWPAARTTRGKHVDAPPRGPSIAPTRGAPGRGPGSDRSDLGAGAPRELERPRRRVASSDVDRSSRVRI